MEKWAQRLSSVLYARAISRGAPEGLWQASIDQFLACMQDKHSHDTQRHPRECPGEDTCQERQMTYSV